MALIATLGGLTARIARELHRSTDGTFALEIREAIEQAINTYSNEPFSFLQAVSTGRTTTADQQQDSLPSDLVRLDQVTVTFSNRAYPAEPIGFDQMLYLTSTPSVTSRPYRYSLYDDQIWWYPIPDAAYTNTLYYIQQLTEMTEPDDTNAWITDGQRLLLNAVLADLGPLADAPLPKIQLYERRRDEALQDLRRDAHGRTALGIITPRRL